MDEWVRAASGLYQLRRDGASTPLTSYVDRSLQRGDQLAQAHNLAAWLPEQVITLLFDNIAESKYKVPAEIPVVNDGRLLVPTPVQLAVLLAPGQAEGPHPLRPYLWPVLDQRQELVLEPGEALLESTHVERPPSMKYGAGARAHLTTHRIVTVARLSLPKEQRGDYHLSLGLISPTLMEGYAVLKQVARIGQDKHRMWVQHVRWEWLTSITRRTTKQDKKKLFGGRGPQHTVYSFIGQVRYPWGKVVDISLRSFDDPRLESLREQEKVDLQAAEFGQRLEKTCRNRGLGWTLADSTSREIRDGTVSTDRFDLDPSAALSFPATLLR